jgi:hypothetical protein
VSRFQRVKKDYPVTTVTTHSTTKLTTKTPRSAVTFLKSPVKTPIRHGKNIYNRFYG